MGRKVCTLHPQQFWDSANGVCRICESLTNRKSVRMERIAADMRAYYSTHGSGCRTRFIWRIKKESA